MTHNVRIDPLSLLRAAFCAGAPVTLADGLLTFPERVALKFCTPTAWRTAPHGDCYTVGDLWLFLDCERGGAGPAEYYRRYLELSQRQRVSLVAIDQQSEVRDYFFGKIDHAAAIDNALREVVPAERRESAPRASLLEELLEGPAQPPAEADPEDARDLECLRRWERPCDSALARLRSPASFAFCAAMMENAHSEPAAPAQRNCVGNPNSVISRVLGQPTSSLEPPRPIILVPNEPLSGNLSLQNAEGFLAQGQYLPAAAGARGRVFQWELEVLSRRVAFEVWDDVNALKERRRLGHVVAIFLTGSPYQFKAIEAAWKEPSIARLFNRGWVRSARLPADLRRRAGAPDGAGLQRESASAGQGRAAQGQARSPGFPRRLPVLLAQHARLAMTVDEGAFPTLSLPIPRNEVREALRLS